MEITGTTTDKYDLTTMLATASAPGATEEVLTTRFFSRRKMANAKSLTVLVDSFPADSSGVVCCFLRASADASRCVQLAFRGSFELTTCDSGGWLLQSADSSCPAFWIPQPPLLRTLDNHGRITSEAAAPLVAIDASSEELSMTVKVPAGRVADLVIWSIPPEDGACITDLARPETIERLPTYTWSARGTCALPSEIFKYLIHGHVYQCNFAWPRKWKFCCELDAHELGLRLRALELATGKLLYRLLRLQIVHSVVSRQSTDGAWYHGEWTDRFECHYRFHSGALLLLAGALQEWPDETIRGSLSRGAAFLAARTDDTDLGPWFLHDSLEQSAEMMDEMPKMFAAALPGQVGRGSWMPTRFLGKSLTNKMILNTHVDASVVLDRYGEVTGDSQHADLIRAAVRTTTGMLSRRPAEHLYRLVYSLVYLTLLPAEDVGRLSVPRRLARKLTLRYLVPKLYRLKWALPRVVMPDGYIDRHLAPIHFDVKYHAVNVMDLVRLWRRFPDAELEEVIDNAIQFIVGHQFGVLRWWADDRPRLFSIVIFAEALLHLCMLKDKPDYRHYLAETLLLISRLGLGYPPSIWGGNPEIVAPRDQVACPLTSDPRLIPVNLCDTKRMELIIVNPTDQLIPLAWARPPAFPVLWRVASAHDGPEIRSQVSIPPRSWIVGRESIV